MNSSIARSALLILMALHPNWAFAYIDPNAGGLLFQLLTPVFVAVVGAWLFMRRLIGSFFRRLWRSLRDKIEQ